MNKKGEFKQKDDARLVDRKSDKNARSVTQRERLAIELMKDVKKKQKREDSKDENWDGMKHDKKWEKIFVGERFNDNEMWGGFKDKYPEKIFTDVFRLDQFRNKLFIGYTPYIPKTRSGEKKLEEIKAVEQADKYKEHIDKVWQKVCAHKCNHCEKEAVFDVISPTRNSGWVEISAPATPIVSPTALTVCPVYPLCPFYPGRSTPSTRSAHP